MKHEMLTKQLVREGQRHDFAARVITSLTRLHGLTALGPWISAAQGWMKKTFSGDNKWKTHFSSGLNAERLGEEFASMHRFNRWIDADYKKFDKSLEGHLLEAEKYLYLRLGLKRYPDAFRTFMAQRMNVAKIRVSGEVIANATWKDRRNSGDANTTCGNSFINLLCWHFCFAELNMIGQDHLLCVNGDDSMFGTYNSSPTLVADVKRIMLELGLDLELNERRSPWALTFNGAHGFPARYGREKFIVAAPTPSRFYAKVGWSLDDQPDLMAWNKGVSQAWKAIISHVPCYSIVAEKTYELSSSAQAIRVKPSSHFLFQNLALPSRRFSPDFTRYFECLEAIHSASPHSVFDATIAEQLMAFTRLISETSSLPSLVNSNWVTTMALV